MYLYLKSTRGQKKFSFKNNQKHSQDPFKHLRWRALQQMLVSNTYCCKALHLRCLQGSWFWLFLNENLFWSPLPVLKFILSQKQIFTEHLAQKMKFSIKDFSVNVTKFPANLVKLTEKILNGKLHFLFSNNIQYLWKAL